MVQHGNPSGALAPDFGLALPDPPVGCPISSPHSFASEAEACRAGLEYWGAGLVSNGAEA